MGSSGILRVVIQLLEEHPQGLTNAQLLELAAARGALERDSAEGSKAPYFRVKRSVDSLLKLGFVHQTGVSENEGRPQKVFAIVPQAMDESLRKMLRQAIGNIEDQIRNQFPMADAAHLVAAFEEVLLEDAGRLGLEQRRPTVGRSVLVIRKGPCPGQEEA